MPVMKDRRGTPPPIQKPEAAELGLQRAIAISQGTCWTEDGSGGAIIHGGYREVRISRDIRSRIEWQAGNDDAIGEILDELKKPKVRQPIRRVGQRKTFK